MQQTLEDFYRGDTQIYKLILKDPNGNPIDLTGAAIWFTMKRNPNDPDANAVVQKKVTNHIDPTNGVTEVRLEASDTANIQPATYFFDFQYVSASGEVRTLLAGKVKVLMDITRSFS